MLSLVTPEKRVPEDHPLRQVKVMAEDALRTLSPVFEQMYSSVGRPSIPPERLLKATLLMALYTVRSERMLCEQIEYNRPSSRADAWKAPSAAPHGLP
jgi:transposase